jgi:hypothetical protein
MDYNPEVLKRSHFDHNLLKRSLISFSHEFQERKPCELLIECVLKKLLDMSHFPVLSDSACFQGYEFSNYRNIQS